MSAKPSFDHEILRQVRRENPAASGRELAWMVTEKVRAITGDQRFTTSSGTVRAILDRKKDAWDLEDQVAFPSKPKGVRTQPFANVPPQHLNDMRLRYLRLLARIGRGDTANMPARDRKGAENFAAQLREHRQVVDLMPSGKPYVRNARSDELDGEGEIFTYSARHPGLTERIWKSLTPAERGLAALRFTSDDFEPPGVQECEK